MAKGETEHGLRGLEEFLKLLGSEYRNFRIVAY